MWQIHYFDRTDSSANYLELWEGEEEARLRFVWIVEHFENVRLLPLIGD